MTQLPEAVMAAIFPTLGQCYHQWVMVLITSNTEPHERSYWQCAQCGKRKEAQP